MIKVWIISKVNKWTNIRDQNVQNVPREHKRGTVHGILGDRKQEVHHATLQHINCIERLIKHNQHVLLQARIIMVKIKIIQWAGELLYTQYEWASSIFRSGNCIKFLFMFWKTQKYRHVSKTASIPTNRFKLKSGHVLSSSRQIEMYLLILMCVKFSETLY